MESKFIPTLQAGNGYTYLKLKGILDEDNLLANLLSQIQGRLLLIDMAEIDRINSCGVRDWVNWLNQIQALGIAVILLRCSPAVVSQANMVTNFAADAFIHSFFAPYVHPDTGDEQSVLIFTEDIRQNLPVRAPKIYNEQGEELEFDEFEESYFAFISDPRILNYQISPDVQAVIQYYLPEATSRQPVVGMRAQQAVQQVQSTAQPIPAQSQVSPQMLRSNLGNVPGSSIPNNPQAPRSLFGAQPMAQNPVSGMGQSGINSMAYAQSQNAQNSVMNHAMPKSGVAQGFGQPPFAQTNMGRPAPAPIQKPASTYAEAGFGEAATAAYAAPKNMPTPAQAMMRHEQPPLPSNEGAQQIAPQQKPQPTGPMNQPFAQSAADPIPSAPPRPAPAPVSPLAQQSIARLSLAQSLPQTQPTPSAPDMASISGQNFPPQGYALRNDEGLGKNKRVILVIASCVVVLLIITLIIVLISKA